MIQTLISTEEWLNICNVTSTSDFCGGMHLFVYVGQAQKGQV